MNVILKKTMLVCWVGCALLIVNEALADKSIADRLNDIGKAVSQAASDPAKSTNKAATQPQDTPKPSPPAQPTPSAQPVQPAQPAQPAASAQSAVVDLFSGDWYDERKGVGLTISGNEGKSTYSPNPQINDGDVVLTFERTNARVIKGKILNWLASPPIWVTTIGRIEHEGVLEFGHTNSWLIRRNAPVLTEPYPSGVRYIIATCRGSSVAFAQLPAEAPLLSWPAKGTSVKGNPDPATPAFLKLLATEAIQVQQLQCPAAQLEKSLEVYFTTGPLPRLPIDPRDFTEARLKLDIRPGEFYYWNAAVMQAQEAKMAEARKQEQEAKISQAKAANSRREALIKNYSALVLDDSALTVLHSNPFAYEGKIVALSANFTRMENATTALFEQLAGMGFRGSPFIIADNIPRGTLAGPIRTLLIGKVMGRVKVPELQGFDVLHLKYVALMQCTPGSGC